MPVGQKVGWFAGHQISSVPGELGRSFQVEGEGIGWEDVSKCLPGDIAKVRVIGGVTVGATKEATAGIAEWWWVGRGGEQGDKPGDVFVSKEGDA